MEEEFTGLCVTVWPRPEANHRGRGPGQGLGVLPSYHRTQIYVGWRIAFISHYSDLCWLMLASGK